ncbi:MAG: helix-turn-helix domain-containing protein [Microcoleus sp.]
MVEHLPIRGAIGANNSFHRSQLPTDLQLRQQIVTARKSLQLSQRDLATHIGKSQSWVRDIESGRLQVGFKEQQLLLKVLGLMPV